MRHPTFRLPLQAENQSILKIIPRLAVKRLKYPSSHKMLGVRSAGHNAYFSGNQLATLSVSVISQRKWCLSTELSTEVGEPNCRATCTRSGRAKAEVSSRRKKHYQHSQIGQLPVSNDQIIPHLSQQKTLEMRVKKPRLVSPFTSYVSRLRKAG